LDVQYSMPIRMLNKTHLNGSMARAPGAGMRRNERNVICKELDSLWLLAPGDTGTGQFSPKSLPDLQLFNNRIGIQYSLFRKYFVIILSIISLIRD
jgi:hypothetical protein